MSDTFFYFVYMPIALVLSVVFTEYAMRNGWPFLRMMLTALAAGGALYLFTTALFVIGAP